jgi:S-adenosylmethionine hydrolase
MALITFMSDFGYSDHYVAAVKAKIYQMAPTVQIIDISHNIAHFDIAHGAYVLDAVFRDFPHGTVHIVGVNSFSYLRYTYIAIKLEGHFFVGPDNGILGLISEQEPEAVVKIDKDQYLASSFPEKEVFAPVAVKLASGSSILEIGSPFEGMKKMIGRKIKATKKQITGNVLRVDHYGNLVTNIDKNTFDFLSKEKTFKVVLGREILTQLNENQNFSEDGEIFAFFNSKGFLQIGINKGNASELLGLHFDSNISIVFSE